MSSSASGLLVRAHGKINLGLEVLGKRADGFHEIRTIMARIALHDTIELHHAAGLGVRWPSGTLAPSDDLIRRTAQCLRDRASGPVGARIVVTKRIPMAAGVGGGSADAAATLAGLNRLWSLGLPRSALHGIASDLGSDIPFFLGPSPSLASGRGELLRPLRLQRIPWLVLVTPTWTTERKTARLYGALQADSFSDGSAVNRLAVTLETGESLIQVPLPNAFEHVMDSVFPDWSGLRASLERATGRSFWLTGAGPALFTLAESRASAKEIARHAVSQGQPFVVTRLVAAPPRVFKASC